MILSASSCSLNIQFWQGCFNGPQHRGTNYLSSIQIHDIGITREIAICRNLFARIHIRQDLSYIEVFDWKQSTSSSHCKAHSVSWHEDRSVYFFFPWIFLMTHFQDAIRLLPGDRLLAFSEDRMLICSFTTAGEAGLAPPVVIPHVTEPHWKLLCTRTNKSRRIVQGALEWHCRVFCRQSEEYPCSAQWEWGTSLSSIDGVSPVIEMTDLCHWIGEDIHSIGGPSNYTPELYHGKKEKPVDMGSSPVSVAFRDYPTTCIKYHNWMMRRVVSSVWFSGRRDDSCIHRR